LGKGIEYIKCQNSDRIVFDRIENVMFIIRGLDRKDNISSGSRISISLDKSYGIVENSYSNKVRINDRQYLIKDNNFIEGAFAILSYDIEKDSSDEIKLVAQYEPTLLDKNVSIVSKNATKKVKYEDGESYDFEKNQNKLKNYSYFEINTKVKNSSIEFSKAEEIEDILNYTFFEGDRIYKDDSNKVVLVFKGLDRLDSFEDGKFVKHIDED